MHRVIVWIAFAEIIHHLLWALHLCVLWTARRNENGYLFINTRAWWVFVFLFVYIWPYLDLATILFRLPCIRRRLFVSLTTTVGHTNFPKSTIESIAVCTQVENNWLNEWRSIPYLAERWERFARQSPTTIYIPSLNANVQLTRKRKKCKMTLEYGRKQAAVTRMGIVDIARRRRRHHHYRKETVQHVLYRWKCDAEKSINTGTKWQRRLRRNSGSRLVTQCYCVCLPNQNISHIFRRLPKNGAPHSPFSPVFLPNTFCQCHSMHASKPI